MSLKGKVAVVTGSTSGIGLGIARALAAEGVDVVLNGLGSPEEIEATRSALEAEFGVRALYSGANLMNAAEVTALVTGAEAALGRVDILVNNAGMQHVAAVESFPDDKWQAIMRLNLDAAFYATKAAIPGMKARGWGRIINTASAHSLVASPFKSAYVAAKHGLAGFTKTVALELATSGVTANCISPGYVWTPLVERQIPETMAARNLSREEVIEHVLLESQPTKQFAAVEDIGALAAFLCSDRAAQITGANLSIDGGWTAH